MSVFLTSQKKLAAAAGITAEHLSLIKTGKQGISPELAEKLERITSIKSVVWASAGKKKRQLDASLKRFLKEELARESAAIASLSALNNGRQAKRC